MKVSLKLSPPDKQRKTTVILGVFEDGTLTPAGKVIDKDCHSYLSKLMKQGVFQAKIGSTFSLFDVADGRYANILLVGCGNTSNLKPAGFRKLVGNAIKAIADTNIATATCYLGEIDVAGHSLLWKMKQMAEVAICSLYRFDLFKSKKEPLSSLKELIIDLPDAKQKAAAETAIEQGQAIAIGMTLTKNLANLPSNVCTPNFLAMQAEELAKMYRGKLSVNILNEKVMHKLGMGALLGVSQGSAEEAFLICLEYKGGNKKQAPVALIGKGITFDTGGNSLKPADSMVGMKYDMCGAATVLGTLKAVAELELPMNVVGLIAAVENMPGGTAYKPEDILTSMSGQTIEVISTDAEGRLVLADALTYCERYKPEVVIDIATLTGAAVIALGFHTTALLSNDEQLAQDLLAAGVKSHDRAWQLPMFDEYQEQIRSPFADMANTGGRAAGTITAACFLSKFAKKFRWAHLDVAGTAAMMSGTHERHATGRPVPMLTQYLIDKSLSN